MENTYNEEEVKEARVKEVAGTESLAKTQSETRQVIAANEVKAEVEAAAAATANLGPESLCDTEERGDTTFGIADNISRVLNEEKAAAAAIPTFCPAKATTAKVPVPQHSPSRIPDRAQAPCVATTRLEEV